MSKKVKISIQGNEFLIPSTSIQECSYDNETYVHMRAKLCASIIKQYVKKNFPNLKVWAGSDVYSGGSSVRVEVCNQDGSQVNPIDFEKISEWKSILQGGTFNGMIDMYESREDSPTIVSPPGPCSCRNCNLRPSTVIISAGLLLITFFIVTSRSAAAIMPVIDHSQ